MLGHPAVVRYGGNAVERAPEASAVVGLIAVVCVSLTLTAIGLEEAGATNGLQVIGFSAESTALAGAGLVAVADTSAINMNPAALFLIQGSRVDFTPVILQPVLHHRDVLGNDTDGENNPFVLGNLGYATKLALLPRLTIGAGLFSQGGFGTDTRHLTTLFGTRDEASSFLRYVKVAGGVSYQVTDELSIGIAPHLGYSDVSLRLFPDTSTLAVPGGFFGLDIRDQCARNAGLGGLGDTCPADVVFGVKVGAMYKVSQWLTVGGSYTSPVRFNYTGGEATLNLTAVGLGRVNYEARVTGVRWPQQVDVSFAARPTEQLLVALTTSWIHWATINGVTISLTHPSNPLALAIPGLENPRLEVPLQWKNQVVVALGVSYAALQDDAMKNRLVLRAGYNFSNNPVPKETLSPLAPLIIEHRLCGGFGYRFTEHWSFDAAVLYALKNTVTYTNPSLPFGPNATESATGYSVHTTLSYRF